ncbi:complement factor H-like isoform 2-T2 [Leptodactylus fuscus]|uniref:complement factor H-like isoform X2 n=1 Tax=Leptodactylus fuscus TaxID=238119 RepID=UPI003F4F164F
MPSLDHIIAVISLTLWFYAAMPSDAAKCTAPPKIDNAYLFDNGDEDAYSDNQMVIYRCHPGYIGGNIKAICVQRQWKILSPQRCRKKSCGHPGEAAFGTFKLIKGEEFVFGAEVEYTCEDGYRMVSKHKTRICAADGWTNYVPQCEARLCPPVTDDSLTVVSSVFNDEFSMGHVITLKCKNPKDTLIGPSEIYCTSKGEWNMEPPTCKGSCTVQENVMRKNNITLMYNRALHYGDNEDVQFECVSGYTISDPSKLMIRCNRGVLEYPTCSKTESCTVQENDLRKHNIQLMYNGVLHYGDNENVQFECVSGYTISDPSKLMIRCNRGVLEYPTCYYTEWCTVQENELRKHNIQLIYNEALHYRDNEDVQFECVSGYTISDPSKLMIRCNRGVLEYPACSKTAKCAAPPKIDNAYLLGNRDEDAYSDNQMAIYRCHPGYIGGHIKALCVQTKWKILSPQRCQKKYCGHPGEAAFGTFKLIKGEEFVFGAEVEYTCEDGYRMVSKHNTRICAADGWTSYVPHCEARLCPPVTDDSLTVVSSVSNDEFSMGHVITLKCKNPRNTLIGPSEIHCTSKGEWNMKPPTCKESCTVQENELRRNNIQLMYNRALHYGDNEDVQFECVSGYTISDPSKLMIRCNRGVLEYPTCHKTGLCTVQENVMRKRNIQLKYYGALHYGDNEDVQFECVSGYTISDPSKLMIRCNRGVLEYPTCSKTGSLKQQHFGVKAHPSVKASCGRPPETPHGDFVTEMKASYPSGSSVTYKCPQLFKHLGSLKIKCQNGKWTQPPVCLEPCTTSEKNMTENHITLLWRQIREENCNRNYKQREYATKCYVRHGDKIRFACLHGYKISNPKDLQVRCDKGILLYPTCS